MTHSGLLDDGCEGVLAAIVIRWVFKLDVELHWAAVIGAASRVVGPWISAHAGTAMPAETVPEVAWGAVVILAALGIVQAIRST